MITKNKELKEWLTKKAIFFHGLKATWGKGPCWGDPVCSVEEQRQIFWWGRTKTEKFGTFQANSFRHVLLVSSHGTVSVLVWVCVYSGASHTNKCAAEREQRMLQMKISCWNMHPSLVLVRTPCWSLYGLVISHTEGPDLTCAWFSVICMCSEPTDFI